MRILPLLAASSLLLAASPCGRSQDPWSELSRLPPARQHQQSQVYLDRMPAQPWLEAIAAAAASSREPRVERTHALAIRRTKRAIEFPHDADPLLCRAAYVFAAGVIAPRNPGPGERPRNNGRSGPPDHDATPLGRGLAGIAPDADLALAGLLAALDSDRRGDSFAAFLQSWRNGDESFYEALDRTAGTPDSVFFYDVMLQEFRHHFAKRGGAALPGGLQQGHAALHDAFLAYRQYRGFREAVAWSFVLPPDVPLPARLARYEQRHAGAYSLRQQVTMVTAALDYDVAALIAAVNDNAPPLPEPLWSEPYDPFPAWTHTFQELQQRMIDRDGSTDAFLERVEREHRAVAAELRKLAAGCIADGVKGGPKGSAAGPGGLEHMTRPKAPGER